MNEHDLFYLFMIIILEVKGEQGSDKVSTNSKTNQS